tara:strand:- start:466 stop:621 length:156 start_codon:yes stop_codon:yes gene_type:complete
MVDLVLLLFVIRLQHLNQEVQKQLVDRYLLLAVKLFTNSFHQEPLQSQMLV